MQICMCSHCRQMKQQNYETESDTLPRELIYCHTIKLIVSAHCSVLRYPLLTYNDKELICIVGTVMDHFTNQHL